MQTDERILRGIWLAIIMLSAGLAGVVTTVVAPATGAEFSAALGAGGAAFLGTATLGIAVRKFLDE